MNKPVFPDRAWLNAASGYRIFLAELRKGTPSRWYLWDIPLDMNEYPLVHPHAYGSLISLIGSVGELTDSVEIFNAHYTNGCLLSCWKAKDGWFWKVGNTGLERDPAGVVQIKDRPLAAVLENILDGVTAIWKELP